MKVGIVGGHGQIALLLGKLLADRGDVVLGVIRNPAQVDDLQTAGVGPILLDLEEAESSDLAEVFSGLDAVVFAAGAGPGSTKERKATVDRDASNKSVRAAEAAGVSRFLQIGSMGAANPPDDDGIFSHYLRAKAAAEQTLELSGLDWVILRPGGLSDDPPTGRVELGVRVPRGSIPRSDVAGLLVGLLDRPTISKMVLEATSGGVGIAEALDAVLASSPQNER